MTLDQLLGAETALMEINKLATRALGRSATATTTTAAARTRHTAIRRSGGMGGASKRNRATAAAG